MTLSEGVWSKVCEKLIKICVIPEESIKSFRLNSYQLSDDDTVLEIETGADKYELLLSLSALLNTNECECVSNSSTFQSILMEDEKVQIKINSVGIEGYKLYRFEEINNGSDSSVTKLKSILNALAFNHSRTSLNPNSCRYSLIREDYTKILSVLYEVTEKTDSEEVNGTVFRKNVEKLYYSGEDVFKSTEKYLLVPTSILQSKLFFKSSDSEVVKFKIINMESKYLPLVYDVLLCIFFFSTENMRQFHFHELLDYYYDKLRENFNEIGVNVNDVLPPQRYEELLKKFSPFAKMEVALSNCRRYLESLKILDDDNFVTNVVNVFNSDKSCLNSLWKTVLEIHDFVLYTNLSKEDCYKIVERKVGSKNYEFHNWKIIPLEKRSGYLGDYYNLTINFKYNEEKISLKLFAKYLPTYNEAAEKIAKVSFEKEEFFYVKFLMELKKIGLEEITDFLPKCYFARSNDVIVLEDMSVLNYKQPSQGSVLSYECLLEAAKQLAKIHACSLLYEEIMTEKLGRTYRIDDNFSRFLKEALLLDDSGQPQRIFTCGISGALNYLLDVFPDIPKRFSMEKFKEKLKDLYDDMFYAKVRSNKFRNVITHGDLWGNNLLFKGNIFDKPTDCCIIDYQLIRYCPPSHDLLFFLYLNTDKRTRIKHMSRIIHDYYTELSQVFKKYNFDLSKIYTYEAFLESCDFVKTNVVCMASLYLQMVLYPQEKMQSLLLDAERTHYVTQIDRKEVIDEVYINNFYKQRIGEIVEELYEVCDS